MSVKFKRIRKLRFHAFHNAVDTDTLMIKASRVSSRPGGDARHMVALVRRAQSSSLETVYGDKAYISRSNVQFITDTGAYPAIEPKKNLKGHSRGHRAYGRLIREYREDLDEWRRKRQHGRRRLAETVFGVIKVRFGGGLSSRRRSQQRRELLIKVLLHNIERVNFFECAGEVAFSTEPRKGNS